MILLYIIIYVLAYVLCIYGTSFLIFLQSLISGPWLFGRPAPCEASQDPLDLLKFLSVDKEFKQDHCMFSLASICGTSDAVGAMCLQSQPPILHNWMDSLKTGPALVGVLRKLAGNRIAECYLPIEGVRPAVLPVMLLLLVSF